MANHETAIDVSTCDAELLIDLAKKGLIAEEKLIQWLRGVGASDEFIDAATKPVLEVKVNKFDVSCLLDISEEGSVLEKSLISWLRGAGASDEFIGDVLNE